MTKREVVELLLKNPLIIGHALGFTDLTELHNDWMKDMLNSESDKTLLAHRGSYKTTCLTIVIAIMIILEPDENIIFLRKTDNDVTEIVEQVKKILSSELFENISIILYDKKIELVKTNTSEITTNLKKGTKGSVQLLGIGIKGSLTGKHADKVITDDIVNLKDRKSRAEREYTKQVYFELQNIKNRNGRILNTGTPWHKEDAISIMPNVTTCDCYSTGLIDKRQLKQIQNAMPPSLFAANYELKHIAAEDSLFSTPPQFTDDISVIFNGIGHIDAAYGGEDGTAFTAGKRIGNKIYMLGKLRQKHIDKCLDEFLQISTEHKIGTIHVENNADKGYLKKEIQNKKHPVRDYHESMNKYIKISSYLRKHWNNIIWLDGTDKDYISQVMDYTEDAEHDDAPDSAASLVRKLDKPSRDSLI